jgi:hypothetical protein
MNVSSHEGVPSGTQYPTTFRSCLASSFEVVSGNRDSVQRTKESAHNRFHRGLEGQNEEKLLGGPAEVTHLRGARRHPLLNHSQARFLQHARLPGSYTFDRMAFLICLMFASSRL